MTLKRMEQVKYRKSLTRSDLNPGPGKGRGQCHWKTRKQTSPIIISSDEDEQKDQEEGHTKEEEPPQSPPEEEKGNSPYMYTPKSPPYPPPGDDDWETESPPELVTPDEDQDTLTNQEKESQGVPADLSADKDFFHDSDRQLVVQQKFGREIALAPWNP